MGGDFLPAGVDRMRMISLFIGIVPAATCGSSIWAQQPEPAPQLIREVAYNELRDHDTHGFWRYWIEQHTQDETRLQEQVETADGPVTLLVQTNGHPLDTQGRQDEQARLEKLVNSPQDLASHRKDYLDDEKHIARMISMLPDAYVFENLGDEHGCRHVRYRPNPDYVPRTVEARVIHSMAGDLWIDARLKRLSRLEGHLDDNVDFGFGLLGRLDKGGWFRMQRVQVSPTEWKTWEIELHLSGRAFVWKTIARETSERRGGFVAVPAGMTLSQGMNILNQTGTQATPNSTAPYSPVLFTPHR
jgi:macrodomain Ter protein organizer (MatP/YcbG family)